MPATTAGRCKASSRSASSPRSSCRRRRTDLAEPLDQVAAGAELHRRAGEILADRLNAAAEMLRQERLDDGRPRAAIGGTAEAVALVLVEDVGHRDVALLHGRHDLL